MVDATILNNVLNVYSISDQT